MRDAQTIGRMVSLRGALLKDVVGGRSDLRGISLVEADLRGAVFQNVNFRGALFAISDVRGAIFQDCDLVPTVLETATQGEWNGRTTRVFSTQSRTP